GNVCCRRAAIRPTTRPSGRCASTGCPARHLDRLRLLSTRRRKARARPGAVTSVNIGAGPIGQDGAMKSTLALIALPALLAACAASLPGDRSLRDTAELT